MGRTPTAKQARDRVKGFRLTVQLMLTVLALLSLLEVGRTLLRVLLAHH